MIIVVIFAAIPFLLGLVIEYLICRLLKKGLWRVVPPLLLAFVPGVPVIAALLGMLIGWRIWRRLWRPRLIWEKKKE